MVSDSTHFSSDVNAGRLNSVSNSVLATWSTGFSDAGFANGFNPICSAAALSRGCGRFGSNIRVGDIDFVIGMSIRSAKKGKKFAIVDACYRYMQTKIFLRGRKYDAPLGDIAFSSSCTSGSM